MSTKWTERQWLKCDQVLPLLSGGLRRLSEQSVVGVSNRKLRCLMSHFTNLVMENSGDESSLQVAEIMGDWAEGKLNRQELQDRLHDHYDRNPNFAAFGGPFPGVHYGLDLYEDVESVVFWVLKMISGLATEDEVLEQLARDRKLKKTSQGMFMIFEDVIGNPFRPVIFDPRWRTADVVGLARAIYEDRVFDRMPILADALMDAGCEDEQVIAHCRDAGPHARGCWVVDGVLEKE